MPYIVINSTNAFDPANLLEFVTAEEADTKAREIMQSQPQAMVRTALVINTYSAKVTVKVEQSTDVPSVSAD